MKKQLKLTLFIVGVIVGFFLQIPLGLQCRCHMGSWTARFIEGAIALDLVLLVHTVIAIRRKRFYEDCMITVLLMVTSCVWIPFFYRGITGAYLLLTTGTIGGLGH